MWSHPPDPPPPRTWKDQTPTRWTRCPPAPSNGDSPGDEASQDIIWDPTSPTQPHGKGPRTPRVVQISDIVNRIAPQDARPAQCSLLQWIGDGAVSSTPEARPPRARRRSIRPSSVDGLIELARQFDKNMERSDALADAPRHHGDHSASPPGPGPDAAAAAAVDPPAPRRPSESQRAEEELRALFDSSTQGGSGPLSQGAATPGCSLETGRPPPSPLGRTPTPTPPAGPPGSGGGGVSESDAVARGPIQEFEDDWENDDLLNDSLVIAMTQEAEPPPPPKLLPQTTTSGVTARVKPSPSSKPGGDLRGVCPRPKTAQRSTFKLEPNPRYLSPTASTNHAAEPLGAVTPVKTHTPVAMQSSETLTAAVKSAGRADSRGALDPDRSAGDPGGSWDEGGDDQLLFQVCEDVEKLSNSQPTPATPADGRRAATTPLAIGAAWSRSVGGASWQQARGYVRSNSVPGAGGDSVSDRGWSAQMKGGADQSALSQSHPGGRVGPGAFGHYGDASGIFRDDRETGEVFRPQTVTARPPGNSMSHHASFKRHSSHSAVISSKAPACAQGTAPCSTAQIEKKKQEALARKRQRMHDAQKR